ncbi:MAG: hypothetical protein NTX82_02220 [Candidatus Parcubacteria bacterium]|nr:hypothetical protein [Candidatus Parcubacteria bacterium]
MTIKEYIKEYTSGNRIKFKHIMAEVHELLVEIFKFNKKGISEEFEDVFHFIQLWFYWRFGLNGEIWKITRNSANKFMARRSVWRRIYLFVDLPEDISNFVGNYNKVEKVIRHLNKFGISKEKAEEAYKKIILNQ